MSLISKKMIKNGTRIRVLVVDDSVVIRRLVTMALEDDPLIEVVGVAANGAIALSKVEQLNPDLITLDIEMGEMGGLEMLAQLRKTYTSRNLRVIMFSTLTERGATATIDALWLGADDYVGKASNEGSLDRSMAKLRNELIPKIKQYFEFEPDARTVTPVAHRRRPVPSADSSNRSIEVVVIGVSTGGPKALAEIIPQFPDDYPLPVLIVQHMPAVFTRLLAERLQGRTRLKVEEAKDGDLVEPAKILIAPGDFHMRIRKNSGQACVRLDQGPALNSCRPAVDALFCSAEETFGERTVAVMLTGMGHDGLRGTEVLKAHGALIIAQDEGTSVVWGMPGAVVQAGLADEILPLDEIVPEILRRTLPGVAA